MSFFKAIIGVNTLINGVEETKPFSAIYFSAPNLEAAEEAVTKRDVIALFHFDVVMSVEEVTWEETKENCPQRMEKIVKRYSEVILHIGSKKIF
jgi:hypothetical protein